MNKAEQLQEKVTDYKNFSHILLAVSTFLYFGILIKGNEQSTLQLAIIVSITVIFISLAYMFKWLSVKNNNKLLDLDDQHKNMH